jgi:signal transduction histidine kinase
MFEKVSPGALGLVSEPVYAANSVMDVAARGSAISNVYEAPYHLRAEFTKEGLARHSRLEQRQHLGVLLLGLVLCVGLTSWLASRVNEISPFDPTAKPSGDFLAAVQEARHLHSTLDVIGALFGMFTGFALVLRFYALGNRYHLLIGLAYCVTGVEDLVYGLFFFPELFRDEGSLALEIVPLTFAAGRFLMGVTLVLALVLPSWVSPAASARRETLRASLIVLLVVTIAAALLRLPIPPSLSSPTRTLQPIDFVALVALVTAFAGYLARYHRAGEMLDWWVTASLAVNAIGQLLMLLSKVPFDSLFFAAHYFKAAGYMLPLVGFFLYQIIVVREYDRNRRDLIDAREAALEATRAKSEFLANISHEIRTPMNGVLGMTERTLRTDLSREQRDYLVAAKDSAHSLLNLLDDLLDFSKIEAGRFELDLADFSLRECISSSLRTLQTAALDKGLELSVQIDEGVPDALRGDPRRLRQVLVNLVGNALKFTLQGRVQVEVSRESVIPPSVAGTVRVDFHVRDTGIGIPLDKQKIIFDAFRQAD